MDNFTKGNRASIPLSLPFHYISLYKMNHRKIYHYRNEERSERALRLIKLNKTNEEQSACLFNLSKTKWERNHTAAVRLGKVLR